MVKKENKDGFEMVLEIHSAGDSVFLKSILDAEAIAVIQK